MLGVSDVAAGFVIGTNVDVLARRVKMQKWGVPR